jgi:O-succinylbenzoic acid--CoA ligase
MADLLTDIEKRGNKDWLIGGDCRRFSEIAEQLLQELSQLANRETKPKILLAEREPVRFLASFTAAVTAGCPVFLCNPSWVKEEWQQVFELVQPDLIWGGEAKGNRQEENYSIPNPKLQIPNRIMIPTGGSSGRIRFATHTWETLMASVRGFQQYFQVSQVNSFCVLPVYHVSGLMQFLRSITTGGRFAILPFKALEAGERCDIEPGEYFISLVPTQLHRLLQNPETASWLSSFKTVLLGGAPAWGELLQIARHHRIRLAPTYGMTETASQIVSLKPQDFLAGNNSCGQVLPHAKVTVRTPSGEILGANETGIITIEADSLTLGYYSQAQTFNPKSKIQNLKSDDMGFFDSGGYLNIVGRSSNKIITGGENVFPAEVEAAIQATGLVSDVCAIGLPDAQWGQTVTAVYVPRTPEVTPAVLQAALDDKLSKYKRPKYWVPVESLPRNEQGKVNREKLQEIAIHSLQNLL